MTTTVGIDPDAQGYLCVLPEKGAGPPAFYPTPGFERVVASVAAWVPAGAFVVLERQQAMGMKIRGRRQGLQSTFKGGVGYGAWKAALAAHGARVEEVPPARWKGALGCSGGGKEKAVAQAQMIAKANGYEIDWRAVERNAKSRAPCHGKCEAFLLAIYGRRLLAANIKKDLDPSIPDDTSNPGGS